MTSEDRLDELEESLEERLEDIEGCSWVRERGEVTLTVPRDVLLDVMRVLRENSALAFEECIEIAVLERREDRLELRGGPPAPLLEIEESVYRALIMGVRDYVDKHRFPGVVLGLAGDSGRSAVARRCATDPGHIPGVDHVHREYRVPGPERHHQRVGRGHHRY